jgi:hypothetical protein
MTEKSRTRRRTVLLTGAIAVGGLAAGVALWRGAEASAGWSADPAAREAGRKLRRAIDAFYETLPVDNRTWATIFSVPDQLPYTDISPIFSQYIREGSSFDQGEAILRAAGLKVSRLRQRVVEPPAELFPGEQMTQADLRTLTLWPPQYMLVSAMLTPARPDDFTEIGSVTGYIRKTDWKPFGSL